MKKGLVTGVVILLGASLAACGNSTSSSNGPKPSAKNLEIAKSLKKEINTDGQKVAKVKVDPEVVDDQSKNDKAHQVIKVTIVDKEVQSALKADKEAIDDGSATTDQKMYVSGIQDIVHKEAQKLNSKDTIELGYNIDSDNSVLIAGSSKSSDFVPMVSIDDSDLTSN